MSFQKVLSYLESQRVCVAALTTSDGSLHAATVHFAHTEGPLRIIVQTSPDSRKVSRLIDNKETHASVVIGTSEDPDSADITFQLDGLATLCNSDSELVEVYFKKFPEKRGKWANDIFFEVTPTWWRFTDWDGSGSIHILSSQD